MLLADFKAPLLSSDAQSREGNKVSWSRSFFFSFSFELLVFLLAREQIKALIFFPCLVFSLALPKEF